MMLKMSLSCNTVGFQTFVLFKPHMCYITFLKRLFSFCKKKSCIAGTQSTLCVYVLCVDIFLEEEYFYGKKIIVRKLDNNMVLVGGILFEIFYYSSSNR